MILWNDISSDSRIKDFVWWDQELPSLSVIEIERHKSTANYDNIKCLSQQDKETCQQVKQTCQQWLKYDFAMF